MQRRDSNPVNGSKTIRPFDKVRNSQPAKFSKTMLLRNILKLFWHCANVYPKL